MKRPSLAALLLLGAVACTNETLQSGHYTLSLLPDGGPEDLCRLYNGDGGLWSGDLQVAGITVYLTYAVNGVVLEGQFASPVPNEADEFEVDGTQANIAALLHGEDGGTYSCPADTLDAHLTGTVTGAHSFTGQLTLTYTMNANAAGAPGCFAGVPATCELAASFNATAPP